MGIEDLFELFIYKQHQSKHQRSVPVGAAAITNNRVTSAIRMKELLTLSIYSLKI